MVCVVRVLVVVVAAVGVVSAGLALGASLVDGCTYAAGALDGSGDSAQQAVEVRPFAMFAPPATTARCSVVDAQTLVLGGVLADGSNAEVVIVALPSVGRLY